MKKWLISAFLLLAGSAYLSSIVISSINDPLFCADCHTVEYNNYLYPLNSSDLPAHKDKKITCIDCHSRSGLQDELTTKKLLIKAFLVNRSLPAINSLFQSDYTFNESFNVSEFSVLRQNCTKCHDIKKIKTSYFNHSNASNCEQCHLLHKEYQKSKKPEVSFWKRMGEGGHRNLTCGDCHGTDPERLDELPQCTKCHPPNLPPHLLGAQWDRSTCLGCHNDPHLPLKNGVFREGTTKEMCAPCHNKVYRTLTIYDSRHNRLVPSCINCHPKHGEAIYCGRCHSPHAGYHPGSRCYSCHLYVTKCRDCHTEPHAPMSGVPRIAGEKEIWEEYAQAARNRTG